jgi:hypothetical protein
MLLRSSETGVGCSRGNGTKKERGELAMQPNVPPDLETLTQKRLSSGGYSITEDLLRRALEAQDAEESWTAEGRRAASVRIRLAEIA